MTGSLEVVDVHYSYPGGRRPALAGVSCSIESGKVTVLQGDNGSGKSTLARITAGVIEPDSGRVQLKPEPANGFLAAGDAVLLFQNPDEQLFSASVERELAWGLENLGIPASEIADRLHSGLQRFGLTGLAKRPPDSLSDGQKQLVALAALSTMKPKFLILDEPAAFLDLYWRRQLVEIVHEMAREIGVLWLTSRRLEAGGGDCEYLLANGRIIAKDNLGETII